MMKAIVFINTVLIFMLGCAVHHVDESRFPQTDLPERFYLTGEHHSQAQWWMAFDSPELNQLMDEALSKNLDLASAWARLAQSIAIAKREGADLVPSLSLDPNYRHTHSETGRRTVDMDQIRLGLSASYEVDLWKKIASRQRAAQLDAENAREAVESTALTLSSQIAKTWLRQLEEQAKLALLREQEKVSQTFLELNELRFGQGFATAVDVYQQRTQLANTRSQFPGSESNLLVQKNRLSVLLGKAPEVNADFIYEFEVKDEPFPELPPLPQTGLPLELIDQRPDIRSARLNILAADYRVGSAIANQYPTLSLSGSTSVEGDQIDDVFSDWFWNLAGSVFQPVVDGGLREAEVERAEAVLEQRLHEYEQTVLTAIEDVQNALIREQKQRDLLKSLNTEVEMAKKQLSESRSRFLNGLSDYLPVLTALQNVQRLQRNLITAKRVLVEDRVDLYVALGGHWTTEWFEQNREKHLVVEGASK